MLGSSERPLQETYDVAVLDLDGVVYVGADAVPGSPEALNAAQAGGMHLAFVTNNAARPPEEIAAQLREFGPGPGRRVGVLVDHLVPGSKESRVAAEVAASPLGAHVLVVGHPFVDVWAAVKPQRVGLEAWPEIPRSVEWKRGICAALGWPHAEQADIARAWQRILARVSTFADCEPALLGRVEELIDFVTDPDA